jgi:hypothetical protein
MHFFVTPETVTVLPICDVVLCLSVYHRWHHDFGHEGAQHILWTLRTKAQRFMFFELASQQSKYGSMPPDFIDRNQHSIVDYNLRMLGGLFGRPNVEFAAATPASRGKQFRCLFAIQMPGQ